MGVVYQQRRTPGHDPILQTGKASRLILDKSNRQADNRAMSIRLSVLLAAVLLLAAGCTSTDITELMKATSESDATVVVNVSSVYGTAKFIRTNPRTNQTATISPDGTVTIGMK